MSILAISHLIMRYVFLQFPVFLITHLFLFRPLYYLGYAIFSRFNACKFLSISDDVLRKWLQVGSDSFSPLCCFHLRKYPDCLLIASSAKVRFRLLSCKAPLACQWIETDPDYFRSSRDLGAAF